jgi:hypothetical protein
MEIRAGMPKQPIYGGKIGLITETAGITFGEFQNKAFSSPEALCGAALDMDLFPHNCPS